MKEAATKGMRDEDGTDKKEMGTQNTSTDEKSQTRRDLSSVRLEESSDGVQVIIGAPGVKQEDFEVVKGDHTLHVKGETAHGTDVFCVDRHIVLSRQVDLDTALCTHSNGVLTIT